MYVKQWVMGLQVFAFTLPYFFPKEIGPMWFCPIMPRSFPLNPVG